MRLPSRLAHRSKFQVMKHFYTISPEGQPFQKEFSGKEILAKPPKWSEYQLSCTYMRSIIDKLSQSQSLFSGRLLTRLLLFTKPV